jgi:hypothetical protein
MSLLTKEQILAAVDKPTQDVGVPEWGGDVRIRTMSASERDKWEGETYGEGKVNTVDFRARFVALCIVDEKGDRMFTDADVAQLGEKSAAALQRVFNAAQTLNALTNKDVAELEKNSEAAPDGGSSSNSPGV